MILTVIADQVDIQLGRNGLINGGQELSDRHTAGPWARKGTKARRVCVVRIASKRC